MERTATRQSLLVTAAVLVLAAPLGTAHAQATERPPTPASQVAPLPVLPVAPAPAAEPAPEGVEGESQLYTSNQQPPPEVAAARRPKVSVTEGPYSDEEEADRARYRDWRLHRFDRPFTIGLTAGYGVALDNTAEDRAGNAVTLANPYQLGFGLQLGYTTPRYNMYFGAAATYYLGEDDPNAEATVRGVDGVSVLRTTLDLGYEFMMPWLRVRPFFSLGLSTMFIDTKEPDIRDQYNPCFGFGILLAIPMGPLYIGADLRMDFVGGRSLAAANTMGVMGVLGLRL